MNAIVRVSPPQAPGLVLDVVADFSCPWSYLGLRRIDRALQNLSGMADPIFRWHAFRLPRTGLQSRLPPNVSPEFARSSLIAAGQELGVEFRFDQIKGAPDTTDAHRLVRLAARENLHRTVIDLIFKAHFELGRDIASIDELLRIAAQAGMSPTLVEEFTSDAAGREAVEAEEQRLRALGVANVPNLLLNGNVLVPGAADVDTYVQALDQALFPPIAAPAERRLLN